MGIWATRMGNHGFDVNLMDGGFVRASAAGQNGVLLSQAMEVSLGEPHDQRQGDNPGKREANQVEKVEKPGIYPAAIDFP